MIAVAWKCGLRWSKWHVREVAWKNVTVCGCNLSDRYQLSEKPLSDVPAKDCCRTCLFTLRKAQVSS